MKRINLAHVASLAVLILAFTAVRPVFADFSVPPGWSASSARTASNPTELRGYGPVRAEFLSLRDAATGQNVTVSVFDADSAPHALTIVSKYLADLTLSPRVTVNSFPAAKRKYHLVTVANGAKYTGFVAGRSGYVLAAARTEELQRILGSLAVLSGPRVVTDVTKYPMYLDRFDRYGWGFYSFADAENDWHSNVLADEDWCAKYGFRYEVYIQPGGFNGESFGISDVPQTRWKVDEAKKRGLAIAAHLYGMMPNAPEYSDGFEQPASFLETGWYNGSWNAKQESHMSWLDPEGRDYYARQTAEQMQLLVNEPNQTAWLNPFAENGGDAWYNLNNDSSPAATANWRSTLQNQNHLSLSAVSAMYNRPPASPFQSWNDVPVPEYATFAGLSRQIVDMTGQWHIRAEKKLDEGIAGQWWNADVASPDWTSMTMPGSDLFRQFDKTGPNTGDNPDAVQKWCVHDFTLTAGQLAHGPIFLYSFLRPNDPWDKNPAPIYVNGQLLGNASGWDSMDATSALKPGVNRLALRTNIFNGRVFLSTEQPSYFPHLSPERNRLWMMWREWYYRSMFDATRETFDAMRKVDPNRPIKCMAPEGYGYTQFYDLAEHYGALPHFTGEGVWMFPWYKRYGFLHDVPGSSEGAGPMGSITDCFLTMNRVFLEGLNGHEDVFEAQNYIDSPLRSWYESHTAVLRQLGRYDIAGPQIILYRSTAANMYGGPGTPAHAPQQNRRIQGVYDWDIERGAAQACGQSCLYLDELSLREGKLKPYKIMVDCGNDLVNPSSLSIIHKWVADGGTYVVWPFTGHGTITDTDAWPITQLTGCGIAKMRATGTGTVTIAPGQPYLRALAGKTFPDTGKSINSDKIQENMLSVELKPAPGSEVIARFEDGAPAIVVRHIGKGKIVILGSAFFRNSQDLMGIWWPQQNEIDFWTDLMHGLGQPAVNTTNDNRVWPQRYRMNNGLDDVVVLNNFAGADRTVRLTATVDRAPSAVYAVRMNSITPVPFTVSGRIVTVPNVALPKDEVQVYLFRTHDSSDSVQHWWAYQQKMWHAVTPITAPLTPPATHWSDPAVNLTHGWQWTQTLAPGADWTGDDVHDAAWPRYDLDIMNFAGADPKKPIYMRRHFLVPEQWLHDTAATRMVQGVQFMDGTETQVYLNGKQIRDWNRNQNTEMDVSQMLRVGDNVLAIAERPGNGPYLGVSGTTFLTREPAPAQVINLAGVYRNHDKNGPATVTLPGTVTAVFPTKSIFIPADWQGKYIVTCCETAGAGSNPPGAVFVNEHCVRSSGSIRPDVEFDVTRQLIYGADNSISPAEDTRNLLDPVAFNLSGVELRLYPKEQFEKFASVGGMAKPVETPAGDLP